MDQWMKLSKRIKNNNFNEFKANLEHWQSKLSPKHYSLLIFQIINSRNDRQKDYLDLFLKYEVDINAKYNSKEKQLKLHDKTALMLACQQSNFSAVSSLLLHKNIKVNLVDSKGQNCIFYALKNQSEQQCYQIIRTLVNKDLANSSNFQGNSVLFQAVEKKSLRIVEHLLKNLADPNFKCKTTGNTALHKALLNPSSNSQKKKDIILLLLNHKADPMIKNKQEKNCFEIAKEVNFDLDWLIQLIKQTEQPNQQIKFCHQEINSVTKQDQNSVAQIQIISEYEQSDPQEEQEYSVEKLSIQIQNFAKNCQKDHFESWKDIKFIYQELAKIGASMHLKIDIVGSYATGLWTPASDIDVVFTNIESNFIQIEDALEKIFTILWDRTAQLGIRQIYLNNKNTSNCFPNIKIDLIPKLHNRKIDITIFQKKNNSQKYVQYVVTQLSLNPKIKPVFFALHKLLRSFNLNNASKNGLKTYAVYLMILISAANYPANTIGELFVYTIYYYAYIFAYEQLSNGQSRINIYDPLNPTNNVGGRRTDVGRLRDMFRITDYGLRLVSGRNILDYLFNLHNIFQK